MHLLLGHGLLHVLSWLLLHLLLRLHLRLLHLLLRHSLFRLRTLARLLHGLLFHRLLLLHLPFIRLFHTMFLRLVLHFYRALTLALVADTGFLRLLLKILFLKVLLITRRAVVIPLSSRRIAFIRHLLLGVKTRFAVVAHHL